MGLSLIGVWGGGGGGKIVGDGRGGKGQLYSIVLLMDNVPA